MTTPPDPSPDYGHFQLSPAQARWLGYSQRQPATWLGRRLALLARRLVLRGRTDPIDASSEGFRLRVHVKDNVSERKFLFMPQFCDPMERDYLKAHLTPGGVFLDIGANAGLYTLTAARAYDGLQGTGYVLAVEANPVMQDRLRYNVGLNDLNGRVRLAPVALSNRDGEVSFSISNANLGESGLLAAGGRSITVPALTLASLLAAHDIQRIDGMKIDVEGMEDVILAPFLEQSDAGRLPGFIIIENSADRWHVDLLALLAAKGYREQARRKMNLVLVLDRPDQPAS